MVIIGVTDMIPKVRRKCVRHMLPRLASKVKRQCFHLRTIMQIEISFTINLHIIITKSVIGYSRGKNYLLSKSTKMSTFAGESSLL